MATFTGLLLWSTCDGSPVFAQQAKGKQTDKTNYDKKAKAAQALTHAVPGMGTTVDVAGLAKIIDDEIGLRLKQENIKASPRADDTEFLRRVYIDLTGVIPPADKVVAFLDSKEPNKREKLIDELLKDSGYGKQLAEIWASIMVPTDSNNRVLQTENLPSGWRAPSAATSRGTRWSRKW